MNLLLFNLATDADHVTVSFALKWVERLARRFDHIDIITMYEGRHALPPNVTVWSVGRERGYSKVLRIFRFYMIIARILCKRRIHVAFTHMIYDFATLFWPVRVLLRIPNVLWYAHGAVPARLHLAHAAADAVVTSTPEGFRLASRKCHVIGNGVDTNIFTFPQRSDGPVLKLATVGRIGPSKGVDVMVEALDGWTPPDGRDWSFTVVGAGASPDEERYRAEVEQDAERRLGGRVHFPGRLLPDDIVALLGDSDVFVNLSSTGSIDKAILEAMLSGCLVISSNDAFRAMIAGTELEPYGIERSAAALEGGLDRLLAAPPATRAAHRAKFRELAASAHSLDNCIDRLSAVLVKYARTA